MTRHLSFVLLLATGVALTGNGRVAAAQAGAAGQAPAVTVDAASARPAAAQQPPAAAEAAAPAGPQAPAPPEAPGQAGPAAAESQAEPERSAQQEPAKLLSTPGAKALGISILGNQEAPTSLVIVPWKSSELGNSLGMSPLLDDSKQPVDEDVFKRALRYYEIRSGTGTTRQDGGTAGGR